MYLSLVSKSITTHIKQWSFCKPLSHFYQLALADDQYMETRVRRLNLLGGSSGEALLSWLLWSDRKLQITILKWMWIFLILLFMRKIFCNLSFSFYMREQFKITVSSSYSLMRGGACWLSGVQCMGHLMLTGAVTDIFCGVGLGCTVQLVCLSLRGW